MSYSVLRMTGLRSKKNRPGVSSNKPGKGEVSSDDDVDRGVSSDETDRGDFSSDENDDEGVSSA